MTFKQHTTNKQDGFIPRFQSQFLRPRYWGIWLGVLFLLLLAYIPRRWRDPFLAKLGCYIGKKVKRARNRARVNLALCFPEKSVEAREQLIDQMFATIFPTMVCLAQLTLRGANSIQQCIVWQDRHILDAALQKKQNIILFVPHGWAIDIAGVLLAAEGHPVAAMFHHQSNPLVDYLWNKARLRFGGRIHAREAGVRPFIQSVRAGYLGYYLPDEDHGEQQSEFTPFFATYKATLPFIGRLMRLCNATVIPLFPYYDHQTGKLHLRLRASLTDLAESEPAKSARVMNQEIERLIGPQLEHYTWVLQLLKTRQSGEEDPYNEG